MFVALISPGHLHFSLQRVVIQDLVRGQVSWDAEATVGDFILLRSTGVPVYNFCVAGEILFFAECFESTCFFNSFCFSTFRCVLGRFMGAAAKN